MVFDKKKTIVVLEAIVVFEEEQTAEKSRGELRFGRKFVKNDRSDENYDLNMFLEPPGFKKHSFEILFAPGAGK